MGRRFAAWNTKAWGSLSTRFSKERLCSQIILAVFLIALLLGALAPTVIRAENPDAGTGVLTIAMLAFVLLVWMSINCGTTLSDFIVYGFLLVSFGMIVFLASELWETQGQLPDDSPRRRDMILTILFMSLIFIMCTGDTVKKIMVVRDLLGQYKSVYEVDPLGTRETIAKEIRSEFRSKVAANLKQRKAAKNYASQLDRARGSSVSGLANFPAPIQRVADVATTTAQATGQAIKEVAGEVADAVVPGAGQAIAAAAEAATSAGPPRLPFLGQLEQKQKKLKPAATARATGSATSPVASSAPPRRTGPPAAPGFNPGNIAEQARERHRSGLRDTGRLKDLLERKFGRRSRSRW